MIPRKRIDIGWAGLARAALACLHAPRPLRTAVEVESRYGGERAVAALSVRSGFDALLSALALPEGSEILVSAATIRGMTQVIEAHGLVAVPVDLDMHTLSVTPQTLAHACSPRARAVLVAHLFGSRMPMNAVAGFARSHGLLLFEDCAQAYCGDGYAGDPSADATFFSFGPIKTATALAGAVLRLRDPELARSVREAMATWPPQSRRSYFARTAKYALLALLGTRPAYTLFCAACRLFAIDHDRLIAGSVRGFEAERLLTAIRHRPAPPLLALLAHRLRQAPASVPARIAVGTALAKRLPAGSRPGEGADRHTHWVFPVLHDDPEGLARHLLRHGFDATRGGSSLIVVPPPADGSQRGAPQAEAAFRRLLYVPAHEAMSVADAQRLAQAIVDFAGGADVPCRPPSRAPSVRPGAQTPRTTAVGAIPVRR